jgi:hypothetical protein
VRPRPPRFAVLFIGLLALISGGARADVIRWLGWSADESRYAYFLRRPLGETGYTDIWMYVKETRTGDQIGKYVVRNASYYVDHPRDFDDDEELLELKELWYRDSLLRKGWKLGTTLDFKVIGTQSRKAGRESLAIQTARVRIKGRAVDLAPDFSPPRRPRFALLRYRTRPAGPWNVAQKIPIPPMTYGEGKDATTYYLPPTVPTGFQLSPSGKWLASMWQGNGTLPDGFSWPAYAFHTPISVPSG